MKRDEKVIKSLWKMPAKMVKASVLAFTSVFHCHCHCHCLLAFPYHFPFPASVSVIALALTSAPSVSAMATNIE